MSFDASTKRTISEKEPEVYDVILNVSSHGIHNPSSHHAFKPQYIYFIPTKCFFCANTIYPFMDAARCIRCGCFAHRSCCNTKISTLTCQGWSPSSTDSVANSNDTTEDSKLPTSASFPIAAPPRLAVLLNLAEHYNNALPPPGTPHCIWKRGLQELSKDYYLTRMAAPREIEKTVNRLLSDNSTFPGRVFKELRELYMYLTFCCDSDYLVHAREALDNIACSVVSILPTEIGDDMDSLKMVVTVVDWRVLRQDDGSMYDKVFGAARRMGTRMDNALLARLYQQQEREQQEVEEQQKRRMAMTARQREESSGQASAPVECVVDMPRYETIHLKLGKIPGEFAVMDKLERLVEALKLIATASPHKSGGDHCDGGKKVGLAAEEDTDADGLSLEETMQNYDIDADSLMQKFCQILSHETLKYEFYWNAESIFVDYMCREYNWLLGAEGYALVTLQQALRALNPPTSRTSTGAAGAAGTYGEGVHHKNHGADVSQYSNSTLGSRDDDDDVRSRYSSRDEEDRGDVLGLSVHNNETLVRSSSKLKGIAMSPSSKATIRVLASESCTSNEESTTSSE